MPDTSSKPIVALARTLPGKLEIPGADIRIAGEGALSRDDLLRFVKGATILVTWVSERVDTAILDAAGPSLRAVCNFAVGTDNIDLAACRDRRIIVTNTPNAVTEGTADLAWALILAVARRLLPADRFARGSEYPRRGPLGPVEFVGGDLTGRTLLIVGAGRIGRAVALRSIGWGMRVLYVSRSMHWDFELAPLAARRVSLHDGLAEADVVSIHCPLTPETRHLIDAAAIAKMKPHAILINTARGPIVDESALVAALKENRIYGAGLDVFENEPKIHPDLIPLESVVLTPHIGSACRTLPRTHDVDGQENAKAVLAGKEPPNLVR
jgi:glyoxylate reductase